MQRQAESQERIKAALYARVNNDDHGAIQAQLEHMKMGAERHGLEPVSHFTDMNGSREEFDWMMAQATSDNPPFQGIIVYDYSRFSRSVQDWKKWMAELEANGVRVISIEELTDNTPV